VKVTARQEIGCPRNSLRKREDVEISYELILFSLNQNEDPEIINSMFHQLLGSGDRRLVSQNAWRFITKVHDKEKIILIPDQGLDEHEQKFRIKNNNVMSRYDHKIETSLEGIECQGIMKRKLITKRE